MKNKLSRSVKKFRNMKQHDESGAGGFQQITEEEQNVIMTNKLVERIQMQGELFKVTMQLSRATAEHEEMERIYAKYPKDDDAELNSYAEGIELMPKWYGRPYTKKLWLMEMNCKMVDIRSMFIHRNILLDRLKSVGFKQEQFDKIAKGEFVKDLKLLEEMEKCEGI